MQAVMARKYNTPLGILKTLSNRGNTTPKRKAERAAPKLSSKSIFLESNVIVVSLEKAV